MANNRLKHLNELRVKAMAGDKLAAERLAAETFIPHHLRKRNPLKSRTGYSLLGGKHEPIRLVKGVHVTAKTHAGVSCRQTSTMPSDYGLDRLQMLKDRRARREQVAA